MGEDEKQQEQQRHNRCLTIKRVGHRSFGPSVHIHSLHSLAAPCNCLQCSARGGRRMGPPWHGQVEGMTMSVSKLCGTNETG